MLKNKRHEAFVREYLSNNRNGVQAYMKVYGTDAKVAGVNATRLLDNASIQAEIAEEDNKIATKFEITREFIASKLIEVVNDSDAAGDRKNKIAALNSLTKMFGLDAPAKQEIEHKGILINFIKPE
jgi:phage terminase small subunit